MPLSEQEQRLLDEMERSLYHNEADDVTTVGVRRGRASSSAITIGVVAGILGIALLVAGVMIPQPLVGVLGFIVMFAGVVFAIAPPRRMTVARSARDHRLVESLTEKWEHRHDETES